MPPARLLSAFRHIFFRHLTILMPIFAPAPASTPFAHDISICHYYYYAIIIDAISFYCHYRY